MDFRLFARTINMAVRHFLSLMDLSADEIRQIIHRAIEMKQLLKAGATMDLMRHRTGVMVFEKSSTRTRVSFETGITHLGGNAIFLAPTAASGRYSNMDRAPE